ncbi:MAG: polysaccharide deacetylase family protein [Candidatus Thorarchaeota archaeon]
MPTQRQVFAGVHICIIVLIMFPALIIEHSPLGAFYITDSSCDLDARACINVHDAEAWTAESPAGIAITLDDRSVDEWYDIRPLMARYGAKVTFFVTEIDVLSADEIEKLIVLKNEGHEIACHGFRHLDAVEFMKNHSLQSYLDEEIFPAVSFMSEHGLTPTSFAYPFGSRNSTIDDELIKYFLILRSTTYTSNETRVVGLNSTYYDWQPRKVLQAVGIDNLYGNTIEEIVEGLERAKSNNEVLLLYGHMPSNTSGDYVTPINKLETILSSAEAMGLSFYRISDLAPHIESTTTTTTGNVITGPETSIMGTDEIIFMFIISIAAIFVAWGLTTVIFPGKREHILYSPA